ncbi:MAG: hypothetical protein E7021_03445 [Alphaproteobacteria bacterium]|nr:hypothetical protein [Alphaproteobacteria bacterium]
MNCAIVNKTTGDKVNVAAGVMAIVGTLAVLGLFVARVSQEFSKKKAPVSQAQVLKFKSNSR